jgi:hypothetical protein
LLRHPGHSAKGVLRWHLLSKRAARAKNYDGWSGPNSFTRRRCESDTDANQADRPLCGCRECYNARSANPQSADVPLRRPKRHLGTRTPHIREKARNFFVPPTSAVSCFDKASVGCCPSDSVSRMSMEPPSYHPLPASAYRDLGWTSIAAAGDRIATKPVGRALDPHRPVPAWSRTQRSATRGVEGWISGAPNRAQLRRLFATPRASGSFRVFPVLAGTCPSATRRPDCQEILQ